MLTLSNGLALVVNGALSAVRHVVSPVTIAVVLCAISLAWLGYIEVEDLNRRASKPTIERH